jgi:succinyl-diaminopimelate desuccinylase
MQNQNLLSTIENQRDEMTQTLMELIRIPAIAPENGGDGELEKAEKLIQILRTIGFDEIQRYDSEDQRVPSGKRPNIVARYRGENSAETLWVVTHLDIVPPGEESHWTITKPFEPLIKDGKVYGRGAEDNMQSMIASIFAVKAIATLGIRPKRTVALALVADEEQGSRHGIQHLIKQGLFKQNDLVIVPDSGNDNGSFIEIAEKSALWFRIRTAGKQTHASRPHKGLNAHRIGMEYALALDKMLHDKYSEKDERFDPPGSTFEPTKKDKNVDAVNIVPGEDIGHFDCRILPNYDVDEILSRIRQLAEEFEKTTGAKISIELLQKSSAPRPTDANSEAVTKLRETLKTVRGIEPKTGGIGGGTCAAFFRRIGAPAVVWSTIDETAHQPNEYTKIENMINDAKIFASLAIM